MTGDHRPPMRILSLLPGATEIVAALGAADALVGVSHECDHPARVRALPRVTSSAVADGGAREVDDGVRALAAAGEPMFRLDARAIRALRPDLVLTQRLCDVCAVSETDVRALAATLDPAPEVVTLGGTTLDGVLDDIARVARAIGRADAATGLADGLRARMRTVHEALKAARAPRPRVAVVEWTDPVYVAGHWVPEMVRRAGGIDVACTAGAHSVQAAPAAIAVADPQIVVVAPCGYAVARAADAARELASASAWAWLAGRQLWAMDANALLTRPGPRLVDGVETLARVFNPALLGEPDERWAQRVA